MRAKNLPILDLSKKESKYSRARNRTRRRSSLRSSAASSSSVNDLDAVPLRCSAWDGAGAERSSESESDSSSAVGRGSLRSLRRVGWLCRYDAVGSAPISICGPPPGSLLVPASGVIVVRTAGTAAAVGRIFDGGTAPSAAHAYNNTVDLYRGRVMWSSYSSCSCGQLHASARSSQLQGSKGWKAS
jgi:hypothetical protein